MRIAHSLYLFSFSHIKLSFATGTRPEIEEKTNGSQCPYHVQVHITVLPIPSPPLHSSFYPFSPLRHSLSRPLHPYLLSELPWGGVEQLTNVQAAANSPHPKPPPTQHQDTLVHPFSAAPLAPCTPGPLPASLRARGARGERAAPLQRRVASTHQGTSRGHSTLPPQYTPDTRMRLICC